ncbi:RagB/SusD family nutrient uptake outer membrane protein [Mucilaginibacter jinjuensis]|uniref:RagB/SusD family nutrient uptake outer membrane protein n=1 Tax=Mucilaginibacter jinjuensis TaxID=1176721 RepID=A0ABY7T1Z0_9SPHI|nr:RagB/SusD family nutrient uptake outer membrane protein [Mucilaginibacter jinjuensis]WCT10411.1 RagB/SusD family nutrient uptake outer membrane protein [Mucilaginibacter jinjuensis]
MKTKYYLYITLFAAAAFSACQKLNEDPKASLTPQTYFKTQSDLDASVAAIYQQLTIDGAWAFTSKSTSYFGADDLTTDPGLNKGDMRAFDQLNGSAGNSSMVAEWQGPWTAIYQANNVLSNYQKVNSTDVLKNQAAGQAYFLRALGYYYLVRTFGAVPIINGTIDVNDRPDRSPVADVYNFIVGDLKAAKRLLPVSFPGLPGKANQMAARSLLADVYLTMAGWPLKVTSNYALAASEADTVINQGGYTLVSDFGKVFTTNNSTESVFALQFNVGGGSPNRTFGSSCVPLDEVATNGSSGWDDYYPEINFYLNAPKCTRTDATFYTTIKLLQADKTTFKLVDWSSKETHAGHPYYKKFRAGVGDGVTETATALLSINPSTNKATDIIRYPLVLLDYAEATAMAGSAPTAQGYAAINQVRHRAGLPDLTAGLGGTAFRDSVVKERAYEFAGEFGIRWFDIARLQLLPQINAARSPLENPLILTGGDLSTRYLAPIPINEMYRNPKWTQNPGY